MTDREPIFTNNAPAGEEWFPRLLAQAATGFNSAMQIITGLLVLAAVGVACGQEGIPEDTPTAQVMPTVEPVPEAPLDVAPTSPPPLDPAATPPAISEAMVAPISLAIPDLVVERSFANLTFGRLTNLLQPEGDPSRLFVTEKEGHILSFDPRPEVEELDVFLDIRQQVSSAGFEEGLLGMAFHPHFSENRRFYVYYSASDPRRSILSQFSVDPANTHIADPASEVVLLEVPQPFDAHNAGDITFGPDGYLYVALGDGGSFGDPLGHAQNRSTLLGAILRIDVDSTSEVGPTVSPRTIPSWRIRTRWMRSGPTGSATPGVSPLTPPPVTFGWPTWATAGGKRSILWSPEGTTAGTLWRGEGVCRQGPSATPADLNCPYIATPGWPANAPSSVGWSTVGMQCPS